MAGCGRLQSSTTRHQRIDDPVRIDSLSAKNLRVICNAVQLRVLEILCTQQWVAAKVLQACLL